MPLAGRERPLAGLCEHATLQLGLSFRDAGRGEDRDHKSQRGTCESSREIRWSTRRLHDCLLARRGRMTLGMHIAVGA